MEQRKLVLIQNAGPIPELNFVNGPIGPTMVSLKNIIRMVQNNRDVYEVNVNNHKDMVKLTVENVKSDNFTSTTRPAEEVHVEEDAKTDETVPEKVVEEVEETVEDSAKKDSTEKTQLNKTNHKNNNKKNKNNNR